MKNPQRANRLSFKTIGQETVILDTKVGQEVHQLNEVGTFVWSLCDGHHDFDTICLKVTEEFDVDFQTAQQDLHNLFQELHSKKLLDEQNL